MSRFFNRKSLIGIAIALALVAAFASGMVLHGGSTAARAASPTTTKSEFCSKLGKSIQASSGAQMYCFGAQQNGPANAKHSATRTYGANVDAANPTEDQAPSGTQSYGQSEVSIAFSGQYVVEAWNDATAFFAGCGSPMNKEEATGFGFSNNGGKSFTDLGGLPNSDCANNLYGGDPSVEAYQVGGKTYFYISSLFNPTFNNTTDFRSHIAMAACVVNGSGSSATLSCSQPVIVASSSECQTSSGFTFCSFLDKDFLSIDPARGLLYASFTEFGFTAHPDDIELAVCDIGNGGLGGTAAAPVCTNGGSGNSTTPAAPYFVVAPADTVNFCEKEGAYPAVNRANGDVYVAYEYNWATALFNSTCFNIPVQESVNLIPKSCLTLPVASCTAPTKTTAANVHSMQGAFIPGYNRFPMNDFPRIATSSLGTVSIVWNDTRFHPAGDILMQSYKLGSLHALAGPVVLDSDPGGWHFLPALRYANSNGILTVSWYDRSSANTAITSVAAAQVNPLTSSTPSNAKVTNVASDWNAVSSDIVPNFGDYTDNYVSGFQVFVAWSDGRLGDPQPFNAKRNAD